MKEIYTDGSCISNPGAGGWGWYQIDKKWAYGCSPDTTNNQMEIMAVVDAISSNKGSLTIYTDSQYVSKAWNGWLDGWVRNNWITSSGNQVANKELWEFLLRVSSGRKIDIVWVKGHDGNIGNEIADKLASEAAKSQTTGKGNGNPYPGWEPSQNEENTDKQKFYGGNSLATEKQIKYAMGLAKKANMHMPEDRLSEMTKTEISELINALKEGKYDTL